MSNKQASLLVWWANSHDQAKADGEGRALRVRYEVHGPGGKLHGGEELPTHLPKDLPCIVLIAPSEVSMLAVTPPKLSGQKLQDALPYVVEPYLLNDPDDNHASLKKGGDGCAPSSHVRRPPVPCTTRARHQPS